MAAPKCTMFWCFLLLVLFLSNSVSSQTVVKTLPGFDGDLPFYLETGYIGVGDLDEIQLFYYFIKSESEEPSGDPLVLWLPTGPGCSVLSSILYENGPIRFNYKNSSIRGKPILEINIYSWTQVANVLYLDAPVGSGFSYSTVSSGYSTSDTQTVSNIYQFLRKWLVKHPEYLENQLVIGGESYSGIIVPALAQEIIEGNAANNYPGLNLQTLVVGNPFTDVTYDINSRVEYAYRVALISEDIYEQAEFQCQGNYVNPNISNAGCVEDLELIHECLVDLNAAMILENKCASFSSRPKNLVKWDLGSLGLNLTDSLFYEANPITSSRFCRNYNYLYAQVWANDPEVREALGVTNGTVGSWERCNKSIAYTYDIESSLQYYKNFFSAKLLRVLVYSGDHDLIIPHVGTEQWIASLNMSVSSDDEWRPWYVDGQVAGYTEIYKKDMFSITYATVKGAGHTAPEYKSKECYNMIGRYLAYFFL